MNIDYQNKFKNKCFMCGVEYTKIKFIRIDNSVELYVNCVRCRSLIRKRDILINKACKLNEQLEKINNEVLDCDWEIYQRQENIIK
jgi:S-adenosylmethionine synthetase